MRPEIPRPLVLIVALIAVVGAITLIELRINATGAGDTRASAKPRPAAQHEQTGHPSRVARETSRTKATFLPDEPNYPRAAEITNPTGFINTKNVSIQRLAEEHKVVLLDFWTYDCINCQHTQPHLNGWYEKYKKDGLVIVGVHTPEFGYESNYSNVRAAVERANIRYPVVLDNHYATWNAYDNHYWPAMYLIDASGHIRYKHIGEGAYRQTDAMIRKLLAERNRRYN